MLSKMDSSSAKNESSRKLPVVFMKRGTKKVKDAKTIRLNAAFVGMSDEVKKLEAALVEKEADLVEKSTVIDRLEAELVEKKASFEKEKQTLQQDNSDLVWELQSLEKQLRANFEQINGLKEQNSKLSADLLALKDEKLVLAGKVSGAEKQVSSLQAEKRRLNGQIAESVERNNKCVKELDQQARAAYLAKNYEQALELYSQAFGVAMTGSNDKTVVATLWNNKAACYAGLKRRETAIEHYSKAIDRDSTDAISFHNRANSYFHLSDLPNALTDIKKALVLDPSWQLAKSLLVKIESAMEAKNNE